MTACAWCRAWHRRAERRRVFARAGVTTALRRFQSHDVRNVFGIDGYNLDLFGELDVASLISKIAARRADIANAPELIDAVTATAATQERCACRLCRPHLGHKSIHGLR